MIRFLLFDLDGTLADTGDANFEAYRAVLAARGIPLSREQYATFNGLPWKVFARILVPTMTDVEMRAISEAKAAAYPEHMGLVRANASLLAFARAQARVQTLALVTTARRDNALAVLRTVGAMDLFPTLVTGDDVTRGKPDPEAYLLCLERLGAAPRECLAFEDSEVGIASARGAGIAVLPVAFNA